MPLTRFSLRQIEAFVSVAEQHSFSAAAERMGLTAQSVSQLVAELEAVLGFRLFDRTTRRVNLSSAGRDFLAPAETVLRHVQAAETSADDVRHQAVGVVRVGAPLALASTALPAAIHDFGLQRPKVVVRIRDLPVDGLVDGVASGDVDLAAGPDRAVGPEVSSEALFDSAWVLWCSPRHPLAARRAVRWAELRGQRLVATGRDHERSVAQMSQTAPEEVRITPIEIVDNLTTALGIASQRSAVTLAPAYVAVLARAFGLVQRRMVEPETLRRVCLYRSMGRALSPAAQGFAEHLRDWLPRWARQVARAGRRSRLQPGAGHSVAVAGTNRRLSMPAK
ncbi:MAG: LysR family transcriptional regulator [Gammaproteobacteria bacterium]|nr:MAG: LysR family transcriptional regulator [Gammaproteobacteria bacterium]